MQLMSCDDEGQRTSTDVVLVCSADAGSGVSIKMQKKCQRCLANGSELINQISQRALAEVAGANVIVLFESFDRRLVAASDPQGAVGHDALCVIDVAQDFLYAPFSWRIAEISLGGCGFQ